MRSTKITVRVAPDELAALKTRARLHGTTAASYLRAVGLGYRPDDPKRLARTAEAWWDSLPPGRRNQVHGWLTTRNQPSEVPGQMVVPLHLGDLR